MSDSRYNETSSRKVRGFRRAPQVKGSGEDSGKWVRCRNCGFVNNVERNTVGQGEGVSYTVGVIDNDIVLSGDNGYILGQTGTTVLIGPEVVRNNIGAESSSGCSFCGSRNWR